MPLFPFFLSFASPASLSLLSLSSCPWLVDTHAVLYWWRRTEAGKNNSTTAFEREEERTPLDQDFSLFKRRCFQEDS